MTALEAQAWVSVARECIATIKQGDQDGQGDRVSPEAQRAIEALEGLAAHFEKDAR